MGKCRNGLRAGLNGHISKKMKKNVPMMKKKEVKTQISNYGKIWTDEKTDEANIEMET